MKKIIKYIAFSIFTCAIYLLFYYTPHLRIYFGSQLESDSTYLHLTDDSYVLLTEGCKVPRFDPFDPTVIEYYESTTGDIPCSGKKYLDVINNTVVLDYSQVQQDYGPENFNCTYKPILRNPKNDTKRADNKFEYGAEKELNFGTTLPYEFVKAFCKTNASLVYEEFLASTPIKPVVEERCGNNSAKQTTSDLLNVIVVGIDSISKINFERHFKLTAEYLRRNLSVFEFHGHMKVADNTFPNLTPMLTGHFVKHYYGPSNKDRYFDDLDFIWKNFSSIGYRTLLAEDAPDMATYNYVKRGFQFPPTDYFFRPLTLPIEDSPWQKHSKVDCFQAKPEILALFDYLRSFLATMQDRPYFAFTWAARLTHGKLNKAGLADKPTVELLRDIHDMGLLNKSLLIFMSDHGIRFGGIRKTYIGKIEERMPFLFLSLPYWFLQAHPILAMNLKTNQKRMTTPFDLHKTLVDVYQMMSGDYNYDPTPYGISLFQEIPRQRNCEMASILPHWCVCHDYLKLSSKDEMVVLGTRTLIANINNLTEPQRHLCAKLKLDNVLDARKRVANAEMLRYIDLKYEGDEKSVLFEDKGVESYLEYLVTVKVKPGGAEFESTLKSLRGKFEVSEISRINMYGNQGDCIRDAEMRKYCYCSKK